MTHRRTINLETLAQSRDSEIEGMVAGIQGRRDSVLWTSEIRATTRGGCKSLIALTIEQTPN